MKKLFTSLATLTFAASAFAVEIGKPAPDFTGTDINGLAVKLSDYKGKIVVIESYNSDCPFCHDQYATGATQDLQKELAAKGVVWLMVNSVNPNNSSHRTPAGWIVEPIRRVSRRTFCEYGWGTGNPPFWRARRMNLRPTIMPEIQRILRMIRCGSYATCQAKKPPTSRFV